MSGRDWKSRPPKGIDDAWLLASDIAEAACEGVHKQLGYGPRPVKTALGYDIVWPDGHVSNQIDVESIQ